MTQRVAESNSICCNYVLHIHTWNDYNLLKRLSSKWTKEETMDHKLVKERLSSTGTSPILLDFKCQPHWLVDALLRGIRCCILSALKEPPASLLYRQVYGLTGLGLRDGLYSKLFLFSLGRLLNLWALSRVVMRRTVFVSDLVSGQWSSSCIDLGCSIDASDGERDGMQAWQQKQQVVSSIHSFLAWLNILSRYGTQ